MTGRVIVCLYLTCLAGGVAHAEATLSETTKPGDFKTIEWVDLIPQDDLDALLSPPDYLDEIADGSPEDQMSNQLQATITAAADDRYQQALVSTAIKAEMNGVAVRLPGFIVPLEYNSEQLITEFFIVPFFGACIHVPPPPPNQIVYVKSSEGFKFDALYKPFWVSGVLQTNLIQNDMATAAYTMDVSTLEYYED
ncbi:hypothetical protein SIN8267_02490 [Sinobacterium norvegicum]|uniref:DUF3299 domain-containing protein n=1 Tax=Sinobacterium norvegicum TaxID=1641715 RepID=A0ABM9AGM8_9GAMM|nr:hypothetical protein SIN8267_02490 [Sinobacterium norvegicum]